MKKTLNNHKVTFIMIGVLFIITASLGLIRIDYEFTAPGYNSNVNEFLIIESDYESSGSFHTTSVISFDRITILQYLTGNLMKKVDIEEIPEYYSNIEPSNLTVMGRLMKDDSMQTALIVASLRAEYAITYESYLTVYLTYNHLTENTLEVGDKILTVNDSTDIYTELRSAECHEEATVTLLRGDEELTYTITRNLQDETDPESSCSFGLYIDVLSEIIDSDIEFELVQTNTRGNSGGLLQTLYVFNQLTEFDYTRGLTIAGTGTIDIEGNVGYIGGVRQKIITSIANGIDVFFVPHLNDEDYDDYIEALAVLEEFETDMILVPVANITEAIEFLENYNE